jgi:micrococcal nuclease
VSSRLIRPHRGEAKANPAASQPYEGYVASKRSLVFHRVDCKAAAKISEKNLVRYNTRDEAVQAGKKPCHECNP